MISVDYCHPISDRVSSVAVPVEMRTACRGSDVSAVRLNSPIAQLNSSPLSLQQLPPLSQRISNLRVAVIKVSAEPKRPPQVQDPTVPMQGYFPEYPQAWMNFHKMFVERARQGNVSIVFLGDSITQGWKDQQDLWQARYGKRGAVNFGIGGDRTQQLLWRIQNGTLNGIQPKLVVLNIGVNNLWGDTFGNARIAEGISKVVTAIRTKLPKTKVLVLGIFPTQQDANNPIRATIKDINTRVAKLDNGKTVRFLDIGPKFLGKDGSLSKDVMPDYLHLSPKGYQIWADAMQVLLNQMLR